jgi:hypothetical protein
VGADERLLTCVGPQMALQQPVWRRPSSSYNWCRLCGLRCASWEHSDWGILAAVFAVKSLVRCGPWPQRAWSAVWTVDFSQGRLLSPQFPWKRLRWSRGRQGQGGWVGNIFCCPCWIGRSAQLPWSSLALKGSLTLHPMDWMPGESRWTWAMRPWGDCLRKWHGCQQVGLV